ncbi:MAG: hypothetical protein KY475_14610 [Planctomycetes bacterium]|nr:hypothetical protein [Planctomycetota bacterium]
MTPDELYDEFAAGFTARKFSAGLLVAFIDFLEHLNVPSLEISDFADFLARFPKQSETAAGKRANTLIVAAPTGKTVSLRPFYNSAERYFRAEQKRFDYPSCDPHATQAWSDYTHWLDALVTFSTGEMNTLRERVCRHVLDTLKSQAFDPSSVRLEPPLFRMLLEDFDLTARKGEPTGAAFQGLVFGFLRADNPHLQIEISKVRTGSKRLQRVGDIDAWEGARLAISAEVKQLSLKADAVPDLEGFANEIGRRGALGLIVALDFEDAARASCEELGLTVLALADMLEVVKLWDPLKQRTAVSSFEYYVKHVEKNSSLGERLDAFLQEGIAIWERPPDAPRGEEA